MKFKRGDRVKAIPHISGNCRRTGCAIMNMEMRDEIGKTGTILEAWGDYSYKTDLAAKSSWTWSPCMLELVKPSLSWEIK